MQFLKHIINFFKSLKLNIMPDLLFQQLSTDLANLQKASQSVIEANNAYQTALKQFYADSNAIPQSPIIVTQ